MITLSYEQYSITLRNPDFSNTEDLEISRINRKSRGGDLLMFRDPIWPVTQNLNYKFSFLKQSDLNNLLHFMDLTLGQTVTLVDYEGRTWTGIIITPGSEVSQPERQDFAAQFQFQGILS